VIHVKFLTYEEALGFPLIILFIIGALVVLAVTVVYVIHRHTPLVKANEQELSFLVHMSLGITVLLTMQFTGKPRSWSCMAHQISLELGFCPCLFYSQKDYFTLILPTGFQYPKPGLYPCTTFIKNSLC
jgi:vomeronasal 2 receptor